MNGLAQIAPLRHRQFLVAVKARACITAGFDLLGQHALVLGGQQCNRTDLVQILAN